MRKLLGLSLVVCAVLSVLIVTNAEAVAPPKVKVCHISPRGSWELPDGTVFFRGLVHEINERALRGHLRHGDIQIAGTAPVHSCCSFRVGPDGTIGPPD